MVLDTVFILWHCGTVALWSRPLNPRKSPAPNMALDWSPNVITLNTV
jgi:hypothetical protein